MIVSPNQFVDSFNFREMRICYVETRELGQGGPTLGHIMVNGRYVYNGVAKAEFGGPFLLQNAAIVAPLLQENRFKLAVVDIATRAIVAKYEAGGELILICDISNNTVFYYSDLANKHLRKLRL